MSIEIKIKSVFDLSYQTDGAAGADLRSTVDVCIAPMSWCKIPTGLCVEIPEGYEGQVRPRSGLSCKHGVVGALGTIDADYRGEISAILYNFGEDAFAIKRGDRIAQLVISPVVTAVFKQVESLSDTPRGSGGFGSTGV